MSEFLLLGSMSVVDMLGFFIIFYLLQTFDYISHVVEKDKELNFWDFLNHESEFLILRRLQGFVYICIFWVLTTTVYKLVTTS